VTIKDLSGILVLLILIVTGCGFPERPEEITISKAAVFKPAIPSEIKTFEQALTAIITICRDDIGLPVVDPLYVKLYKNSVSYAFYGRGWRTLPYDVANSTAFARNNEINIDLEKAGRDRATSIWLLAHEYAHNVHPGIDTVKLEAYGFSSGRLGAEYWYAPKIKWFVKTRTYDRTGVTEEELRGVDLKL
jgi:hypothetical protein